MKVIIVGGVAGGASCAARLRICSSTRILLQNGFKGRNLSVGMTARSMLAAK